MDVPHLEISKIRALAQAAAQRRGYDCATSLQLIDWLLINDVDGYPSHGIQRILHYLDDVREGRADLTAVPTVRKLSQSASEIDANRAVAPVVVPLLIDTLKLLAKESGIGVVCLKSAHHLGRLARIGMAAAEEPNPLVLLGFFNFLGQGMRMAPPGGSEALLCTNPLLVAFPIAGAPPFVLDMSTTTVAEGKVYSATLNGSDVPEGWLVGRDGKATCDPNALYANPPRATMTPLGWPSSPHKGYALGVAIELLVGALARANNIAERGPAGNGGFLVAFEPCRLGLDTAFAEIAATIIRHSTDEANRYAGSNNPAWSGTNPTSETTVPISNSVLSTLIANSGLDMKAYKNG
jgi:LDH2 family malate/lactate/ureidoglycolate dehydrogenase